jgi:hypothetical protein
MYTRLAGFKPILATNLPPLKNSFKKVNTHFLPVGIRKGKTGESLDTNLEFFQLTKPPFPYRWHGKTFLQPNHNPTLDNLPEVPPTLFQAFPSGPNAWQLPTPKPNRPLTADRRPPLCFLL